MEFNNKPANVSNLLNLNWILLYDRALYMYEYVDICIAKEISN